jgi:hypothetical protein
MKNGSYVFVFCLLYEYAQNEKQEDYPYNLEGQLAIQGYDPVAYFKQGRAVAEGIFNKL